MRYQANLTSYATGEVTSFPATEAARWDTLDAAGEMPDSPSKSARTDYLWVWNAARQRGMLGELGADADDAERGVRDLAEAYALDIAKVDAPLA